MIGRPRLHLRATTSTNDRARELAGTGAPHGTLVTAEEQTAGRGRQGRTWIAPAGSSLLLSLVLRETDPLLPLRAGLAVADLAGAAALVKWPNDVLLDGRKVAGVLVEARPQEGWAVLGIGVNAALDIGELPPELRETAGTLGRTDLEATLSELLEHLDRRLAEPAEATLTRAVGTRRPARPPAACGRAAKAPGPGSTTHGRLRVSLPSGEETVLDAGEVHLR